MCAIAALLFVQDCCLDDRKGIALPAFTSAPGRRRCIGVNQNSESEMMLLEPISRIIDRGYVLRFLRTGSRRLGMWCTRRTDAGQAAPRDMAFAVRGAGEP